MTPLPARPLPLATTSAFTPRGRAGSVDTPAWAKAWTHAAQLQQAASEHAEGATDASPPFLPSALRAGADAKPGSSNFAGTASGSPPSEAAPGEATVSAATPISAAPCAVPPIARPPSAIAPGASTPTAAPSVASPAPAAPNLRAPAASAIAPAARSISAVPGLPTLTSPGEQLAEPPLARGAAQRTGLPAAPPHAPVRVHVDRQEDGCVVWLGVDAGAERLARQIVGDLVPSRPGALPVLAVVCNGIPVYTRSRIPKENP